MDIVFDIDGTLADASHRLHFIKDLAFFKPGGITRNLKPDWESFLSDEQVAKDAPMPATWLILKSLISTGSKIIFITGRSELSREMTWKWLIAEEPSLDHNYNRLYMRSKGDRRDSHVVKRELLQLARADGYDPKLVFEDRRAEARMWREEGLLCCHVAEGDY